MKPGYDKDEDDMSDLSRLYAQAPAEEPPAALDDAMLARARRAVSSVPARRPRWELPLATAAVLMLSVAVVMNVERERPDALEVPSPARQPPPVSAEVSGGAAPERRAATVADGAAAERRDAGRPLSGPGASASPEKEAPRAAAVPPPAAAAQRPAPGESAPAAGMRGGASVYAEESRMRDFEAAAPAARKEPAMAGSAAPAPSAAMDVPPVLPAGPAASPPAAPRPPPRPLAEAPASGRSLSAAASPRAPQPAADKAAEAAPAPPRAAVRSRPATKPAPMAAPSSLAQARSPDVAPADRTPGEWFEYLKALKAEGRSREFKEALEEFRRRFPDMRLPPALLPGDEPQD